MMPAKAKRMRVMAEVGRRFGYRRPRVLLEREGYLVNHKATPPWRP
ncbi:hypothetical protein ACVWY3_004945 [Bradyrhizobium sp. USDA 4486]